MKKLKLSKMSGSKDTQTLRFYQTPDNPECAPTSCPPVPATPSQANSSKDPPLKLWVSSKV